MCNKIQYLRKENPSEDDVRPIRNGLRAYNRTFWGDLKNIPNVIEIHDEKNTVVGGAFFYVFGDWLELEYVWIEEAFRRKGIGKGLIAEAEKAARAEGCKKSCLNTFDFQARFFYEKQGYKVVYAQERIPIENTRYYMEKVL